MALQLKILTTLKSRIIFGFSVVLILILSIASFRSYNLLLKNIEQKVFVDQQKILISTAEKVNSLITTDINLVKNISVIFSNYENIPEDFRRDFFQQNLKTIIEENDEIYGLWTIFKPYTIDNLDELYINSTQNISGQFAVTYFRENGKVTQKINDIDDYVKLDSYLKLFNDNNVIVVAPLKDPYWELTGTSYIIRIVVPVVVNNKLIGLVGLDLNYSFLQSIIHNLSYDVIFVDDDLKVIYNKDYRKIDRNLIEIFPFISNNKELQKNIALKNEYSKKAPLFSPNEISFYSLYSMSLKGTSDHWSIIFSTPDSLFIQKSKKKATSILISPIIVFIIIISFFILTINYITNTLREIKKSLSLLFTSKNTIDFKKRNVAEFAEIQQNIIENKETLDKYQKFTDLIIDENFDTKIEFSKNDLLHDNLNKIRDKIIRDHTERKEQVKKQEIEKKISNALAQINTIQRLYNNQLEELAYNTTKYIADFINAIQGGFYVVNREDSDYPFLELKAFHSYNRRIFSKKQIDFSDGLAGTCALEKKTIYSKVPNDYLEITSGLGSNPPNYIFLLPLITNDIVMGVLELAFLDELSEYNMNFLVDASTVIASSIASSENTTKTLKLLNETRNISDEMKDKEKKMNEQIEELENLKIKSEVAELDRSAILNTINKIVFFAEFDNKTNVLSINKNLSEKLQIQTSDAKMLTYFDVFMITDNETHHGYWTSVLQGNTLEFELPVFLGKFNFWFNCILSPVFNSNNKIYKVIFFAIDITEIKLKEDDVKKLMIEMNEKAEQISVQELEMDEFFQEYQSLQTELQNTEEKISTAVDEKLQIEKSLDFIQKEFEKRTNRSKRIEMNLKKKIRALEDEIKTLKG
ncbi:MAG: GAF domain-containing protein [Bacteroidales bacterium]|nr:GAF domain-containing protein [Bacteroidales bacterium]